MKYSKYQTQTFFTQLSDVLFYTNWTQIYSPPFGCLVMVKQIKMCKMCVQALSINLHINLKYIVTYWALYQ